MAKPPRAGLENERPREARSLPGPFTKEIRASLGVRAYERRADLRENNSRLLYYVQAGGTLIVQYNKFEFNQAQYGPYPAKVSSERVTDEYAPVRQLDRDSPMFYTPNRIDDGTWNVYFGSFLLGRFDERERHIHGAHNRGHLKRS